MENAVIRCDRCGRLGAKMRQALHVLCDPCRYDEMADRFDDKCRNCGHSKRSHGDRAISPCAAHVMSLGSWQHRTVPCPCPSWKDMQ